MAFLIVFAALRRVVNVKWHSRGILTICTALWFVRQTDRLFCCLGILFGIDVAYILCHLLLSALFFFLFRS
jgi:hypothetical protein